MANYKFSLWQKGQKKSCIGVFGQIHSQETRWLRLIIALIPFPYLPTQDPVLMISKLTATEVYGQAHSQETRWLRSCPFHPFTPPPHPNPHTHMYSTHLGRVVSELTVTHREHAGTVIGLSPTDRKWWSRFSSLPDLVMRYSTQLCTRTRVWWFRKFDPSKLGELNLLFWGSSLDQLNVIKYQSLKHTYVGIHVRNRWS